MSEATCGDKTSPGYRFAHPGYEGTDSGAPGPLPGTQ
ncbi:hypothetical protein ACVW1B_003316 [Bradyrhizobium sp. USDA 4502]